METKTTVINLATFLATANALKLTPPQQAIVDRLNQGYTLGLNNPHNAHGGDIVWVHPETKQPLYAGRIYRAQQYLHWRVRDALNAQRLRVEGLYTHEFKNARI